MFAIEDSYFEAFDTAQCPAKCTAVKSAIYATYSPSFEQAFAPA